MKKLFSKIETKIDNTSKESSSYIGKVFTVGRQSVTVEDVLAEGDYKTDSKEVNHTLKLFYRGFCNSVLGKRRQWN